MPVIPSNPAEVASQPGSNNDSSSSQGQSGGSQQEHQKPRAQDFISKGPQIPDRKSSGLRSTHLGFYIAYKCLEMPPKASREEIEARMKELNK